MSDQSGSSDDEPINESRVWTKKDPHPYGIPWEGIDDRSEGGTGRFVRDVGGIEPGRLSDFDWDSVESCEDALAGLPDERIQADKYTIH